jgi:hypothetical protein
MSMSVFPRPPIAKIPRKKSALVVLLDDVYSDVCGISPFKYWGGRTFVAKEALTVSQKFHAIKVGYTTQHPRMTDD